MADVEAQLGHGHTFAMIPEKETDGRRLGEKMRRDSWSGEDGESLRTRSEHHGWPEPQLLSALSLKSSLECTFHVRKGNY